MTEEEIKAKSGMPSLLLSGISIISENLFVEEINSSHKNKPSLSKPLKYCLSIPEKRTISK